MLPSRLYVLALLYILLLSTGQTLSAQLDDALDDDLQLVHIHGLLSYSAMQAVEDLAVAYKLVQPDLEMLIASAVSSVAVSNLVTGKTDFAITISSLPYAVIQSSPSVQMVPLLVAGLVPVYNLGSTTSGLILSRSALVLILHVGNHKME